MAAVVIVALALAAASACAMALRAALRALRWMVRLTRALLAVTLLAAAAAYWLPKLIGRGGGDSGET